MKTFNISVDDRFQLSSTSKGNQIKWVKNGVWLKSDSLGYESIAEALVSTLEMFIHRIDYVDYSLCKIHESGYDGVKEYAGCL